ncbi:MAG: hypothetical protein M1834_008707 [Cirrosporium novae-zelandiae]|nr:MAG: hypothetical protein M1834_008707 [Cirrosporium novae-zelandiae]
MDSSPLLSPSKARAEASLAADWALATSFLNSVYHPATPPPFERNDEILKALLQLAAYNERANEGQQLILRAEEQELRELQQAEAQGMEEAREILDAVEENMTDEGRAALATLAETSIGLGVDVYPEEIAKAIVDRTRDEFDRAQQLHRIQTLQDYLESELSRVQAQLDGLRGEQYLTPNSLPEATAKWTRETKLLDRELSDSKDRLAILERAKKPEITVDRLSEKEKEVLTYEERVRNLEAQVDAFHGLPADRELAKKEIDKLERELQRLTRRRDELFEAL